TYYINHSIMCIAPTILLTALFPAKIYAFSLHDALPILKIYYLISIVNIFKAICLLILFILFVLVGLATADARPNLHYDLINPARSEEHTSELQSRFDLV